MALVSVTCGYCGKKARKEAGAVTRARKNGNNLFCDMKCSGRNRRKHKPVAQRKAEKRLYDAEYRQKNLQSIKAKKAAYFKRTYDPIKAAVARKKTMPRHVEYCRRPEYRVKKQKYDLQHRAEAFGPYAEAYLLALDLNREIKQRMTNYDIKIKNGTFGKRQARTREAGQERTRHRSRAA